MASSSLLPAQRRGRIHELLRTQGAVKVTDLSERLKVSEITIRRDLEVLEQEGILERTHGGAIYSHRMRVEPLYMEKDRIHRDEKELIGRAAAQLVEDGDTLLINSGSTTLQVIRHLVGKKNIRIITSNAGAVLAVQDSDVDLMLIGGSFRPQSNSLVGPLAVLSLQQIYGSKAFIGVDGISAKYGLTTPILHEAEVARLIIERTRGLVIVVADHSKLGVVADFVTAPLEKVDILVTDGGFDDEYRSGLEEPGVKITIASHDSINPFTR
ncbi:MAG: DeoR/GlpR transcriptional regulator [Chloroflexi bacterium]|nr:DeoR/GlpR transcriptional regulator [Chloroflexota bacterium]